MTMTKREILAQLPDTASVPVSFPREVIEELDAEIESPSPERVEELTILMWRKIGMRNYLRDVAPRSVDT